MNWKRVVEAALHPIQLEILEAAAERDRISPVQFCRDNAELTRVAYHFRALCKLGILESAGTTPRRGATEHFYRLSASARERD